MYNFERWKIVLFEGVNWFWGIILLDYRHILVNYLFMIKLSFGF